MEFTTTKLRMNTCTYVKRYAYCQKPVKEAYISLLRVATELVTAEGELRVTSVSNARMASSFALPSMTKNSHNKTKTMTNKTNNKQIKRDKRTSVWVDLLQCDIEIKKLLKDFLQCLKYVLFEQLSQDG